MALRHLLSRSVRSSAPAFWQRLKYYQYDYGGEGEREIQIVDRFVDPNRAALDIGVHSGMYTRHLARYAKCVFGFEANPDSADFAARCLRNVATIVPVALSDRDGFASLRIPVHGG